VFEALEKIFRDNEPELVLLSYSENHTGTFQLLDCDGYRLGKIICEEIYLLCVTTQWGSFNKIKILPVTELRAGDAFFWVRENTPADYILVWLTPSSDDDGDQESALPTIANTQQGYILCKSITFAEEDSPER
jgi:hypothetical protein